MCSKGVCRKQHENLQIAFEKACDYGLIDHHIPHRVYDYSIYFDREELAELYASDRNLRNRVSPFKPVEESKKPSVLLGVVLGAHRRGVHEIYNDLKEDDININ